MDEPEFKERPHSKGRGRKGWVKSGQVGLWTCARAGVHTPLWTTSAIFLRIFHTKNIEMHAAMSCCRVCEQSFPCFRNWNILLQYWNWYVENSLASSSSHWWNLFNKNVSAVFTYLTLLRFDLTFWKEFVSLLVLTPNGGNTIQCLKNEIPRCFAKILKITCLFFLFLRCLHRHKLILRTFLS